MNFFIAEVAKYWCTKLPEYCEFYLSAFNGTWCKSTLHYGYWFGNGKLSFNLLVI